MKAERLKFEDWRDLSKMAARYGAHALAADFALLAHERDALDRRQRCNFNVPGCDCLDGWADRYLRRSMERLRRTR